MTDLKDLLGEVERNKEEEEEAVVGIGTDAVHAAVGLVEDPAEGERPEDDPPHLEGGEEEGKDCHAQVRLDGGGRSEHVHRLRVGFLCAT